MAELSKKTKPRKVLSNAEINDFMLNMNSDSDSDVVSTFGDDTYIPSSDDADSSSSDDTMDERDTETGTSGSLGKEITLENDNRDERSPEPKLQNSTVNNADNTLDANPSLEPIIEALDANPSEPVGEEITPELMPQNRSRKRHRQEQNWARNVRKQCRQEGKEYVTAKGKHVPSKEVKNFKDCLKSCRYKCALKCSATERRDIHQSFFTMDLNGKRSFILSSSECVDKERTCTKSENSRRKKSYSFWFRLKGAKCQVCKPFYLGTLAVSQKMVYGAHEKKNQVTGTPGKSKWGKHKKNNISELRVRQVTDHINSFPAVESHYCRQSTQKKYLSSNLNVNKMYDLYLEHYSGSEGFEPVKASFYRHIFVTKFNLDFHIPKSDRCDLCEEVKVKKNGGSLTEDLNATYEIHLKNKEAMRDEKAKDKNSGLDCLIMFDLENVLSMPRADISSFFYKRKLNVYNLTAYEAKNDQGYCAIWCELTGGRAGNDIASALVKILEKVVESNPNITSITTWSDSCTPQNRNSIMSYAMMLFLKAHPNINHIKMKFSVPGHSCVQEVDNMHSQIEKALRKTEVFSPISLLRVLLNMRKKKPFRVIQLKKDDFKDFQSCSKPFAFNLVPFTKLSFLQFGHDLNVNFKLSHCSDEPLSVVNVRPPLRTRKQQVNGEELGAQTCLKMPLVISRVTKLDQNKIKDLKDMLKFMSLNDQQYYTSKGISLN